MNDLERRIGFIREIERLKSTERTAWTATGRRESTAEHSWRLAMLCWCVAGEVPDVNLERALLLCMVHDLGELYEGDRSAALDPDPGSKHRVEEQAMQALAGMLPEAQGGELLALWREYEAGETPEARLVKALDKAETILQHNQGQSNPVIDFGFNLDYGRAYFPEEGVLAELRALLDAQTRHNMHIAGGSPIKGKDGVTMDDRKLISEAMEARKGAYTPYSGFQVGAALLTKSGKVYRGCNIESASYSPTVCAERTAFFKAVSEGEREFAAIAVVGGAKDSDPAGWAFSYPCGVCRQVMVEFCGPDFHIVVGRGDDIETYTLAELLPHGFGPANLE